MAEFLMKPKIDFAFKEIMMDDRARTGFLAAILKVRLQDIRETVILNTGLRREHIDDKQGILDVRLLLNNDMEIDIEIQLSKMAVWADRSLFYLAKMFTGQIKPGEPYHVFKKCVGIGILDFILFEDSGSQQPLGSIQGTAATQGLDSLQNGDTQEPDRDSLFYSRFHIREDTRHFIYTDKMEFHLIELPKLPKELLENSSDIERWAKFINAEQKEEFDMLANIDPNIASAYPTLQAISQDKAKRMEYEAREKAIHDYNTGILEAQERGIEIGTERGIERGIEIGTERINKLHAYLIHEKRFDDLERATQDKGFQQQLLSDYGI